MSNLHLRVDWGWAVWLGPTCLGDLTDDGPNWPRRFGPEPGWFEDELDELRAELVDAQGNDYRPDAEAAFWRANGGIAR